MENVEFRGFQSESAEPPWTGIPGFFKSSGLLVRTARNSVLKRNFFRRQKSMLEFWDSKMERNDFIFEVLDESRSFFRVHTGYFSNIPKCIKAEFIASWACSQSSVVSSSQR
ncbi:hypothetical protein TNCV_2776661 [Trichonephila clavipes]|nr:hypothetical protein TNCV_2776661 [Trichonephila clavipes]